MANENFLDCFIGNSQAISDDKQELAELFKMAVSLANEHFQISWFSKVSAPIIALFRNQESFIFFVVGISLALLIFHKQLKKVSNSFMAWLKKV